MMMYVKYFLNWINEFGGLNICSNLLVSVCVWAKT